MKEESRIKNTIRNTLYGVCGQIISYIFNFAYRTVFIHVLSINYLGVNGLFGDILSMLSLAELGVGSAITFSLYKPLAENDRKKLKGLMRYYCKAYKIIGVTVAIIGISLLPFLDYIIKDKPNIPNLNLIYILYLVDSVTTYFFAYKRSIIIADQQGYIDIINKNIFIIIRSLLQIVILILTGNFIYTLIIQVICSFMSNLSISRKADKLHSFLKEKDKCILDVSTKKDLFKKIRAMFYHNIGSVVVLGTDNLLMASYIGVYWVGIYSNYSMIINIISSFVRQFTDTIVASIGNMTSLDSTEKSYNVFNVLFFVNYWIYCFASICLITLLNPFITLWIGEKYILNQSIVLLIVLNFYIGGMRQNVIAFRNTLGLFWNDRYKPIFESIINLVASIILLKKIGIAGVFLGTSISLASTSLWVEPYILFKHYFKKSPKKYFVKYISRFFLTSCLAMFMLLISKKIFDGSLGSLIILVILCFILINLILFAIFFRRKEFKYIGSIIKYRKRL